MEVCLKPSYIHLPPLAELFLKAGGERKIITAVSACDPLSKKFLSEHKHQQPTAS
jgi:hypothetical protein